MKLMEMYINNFAASHIIQEIYVYTDTYALKALKEAQKDSDVTLFKEWANRFSNHMLLTQGMSKMFGYLVFDFTFLRNILG